MITDLKLYICQCDGCGDVWEDNQSGYAAFADTVALENLLGDDDDWTAEGCKHYCPNCWDLDKDAQVFLVNKPY